MRPHAQAQARVGASFGRYEILAPIASGGMGAVYVAKVRGAGGFQRRVALKVLHPHFATDEDFVAMFLDEARLAARIHHPNVVATLDVVEDPELAIVMELVEGAHLGALAKRARQEGGRLEASVVLRIVLDALEGLGAAHALADERGQSLGLVHRDVSPQNILVGADGVSRLTDFGVARAEARLGATRDGTIKGKLGYMAPEHVSGAPIDLRADLFAMGVVLWESLAGRRLFSGDSTAELVARISTGVVPPLSETASKLATLDAVLARALARQPDERFASAGEMAAAIEDSGMLIASRRKVAETVRALATDSLVRVRAAMETPSFVGAAKDPTGPTAAHLPRASPQEDITKQLTRPIGGGPASLPVELAVTAAPSLAPVDAPASQPRSARRWPIALAVVASIATAAGAYAFVAWRSAVVAPPSTSSAPIGAAPDARGLPPPSLADSVEGTVRVMGSDTLGASLLPEIARAVEQDHPGVHVEIEALGSATAFVGLFDASADVGAASRPIHDDEREEAERLGLSLREAQLGWDGVAIIVHRGRTLPSLDLDTLRAIYAGHAPDELGTFHVIARPAESGTHAFFEERVMAGRSLSREALTIEHNDEIVRYVSSDPAAIAYVGAGFVTDEVQVVPVLDEQRVPRAPDRRTLTNGAYPLARPLLLYVPAETSEATLVLVRALFSDVGRAAIDAHGFVAADAPPPWLEAAAASAGIPDRTPFRVVFAPGTDALVPDDEAALGAWLAARDAAARASFVVEGHAAAEEEEPAEISARRAAAVARALARLGIDGARTTTVGLGASRPIGPLGSERRRTLGARVEVFAVERAPTP